MHFYGSLILYCPQFSISMIFEKRVTDPQTDAWTNGPTNQWTHRRTEGLTDKASYRDAWTYLKKVKNCSLVYSSHTSKTKGTNFSHESVHFRTRN